MSVDLGILDEPKTEDDSLKDNRNSICPKVKFIYTVHWSKLKIFIISSKDFMNHLLPAKNKYQEQNKDKSWVLNCTLFVTITLFFFFLTDQL